MIVVAAAFGVVVIVIAPFFIVSVAGHPALPAWVFALAFAAAWERFVAIAISALRGATRWLTAHLRTLQPLLAQPPATVARWPRAALIGDLGLGPFVPTIVRIAMLAPIGAWWLFARSRVRRVPAGRSPGRSVVTFMLAHRSLSLSITLLCAASAAACVTNPTDGGASETRTHLEFDGYAAAGLAPLQLWAWNLERSRWELVSEFLSSDETLGDDPPLYRWDHATTLGRRYWVPAASTCASTGSALFQVRELREGRWTALKTFDSAGMVCLADQLQAGETYVAAGGACTTGETVRVTGPAACVPTGRAWTLPRTLDASDGISVWRLETYPVVTSAVGRPLHLRGDAYASRAIGRITLTAEATVTCRVTGGSTLQARRTFTRTQTEGTTGGLGAGTLGVDLILDGSNLRPLCPSGTTLGQASVFSSVTAAFTDGSTGPSVAAEGTVIMPF